MATNRQQGGAADLTHALTPTSGVRGRVGLYFYSTRHIVGCALALVGIGLHLAGLLTAWWLPAIVALYVIGALVVPGRRRSRLQIDNEANARQIEEQLDRLVKAVRQKLPPDLLEKVESIRDSIETILPRTTGSAGDPTLYSVRQTALDYLPSALNTYLSLPPAFARTHKIDGHQTAKDALDEQLALLDARMKEVVTSVLTDDSEKLLANGRFLQQRFGTGGQELTLPPSD